MAWKYTTPDLCSLGCLLQRREDRQQSLFGLSVGQKWLLYGQKWLLNDCLGQGDIPLLQQGPKGPEESPGMDGANWQHCPLQWGLTVLWGIVSVFNQVQDIWEP